MKNYEEAIGIDVSKLTIDAYIHKKRLHRLFMNTTRGFKELLIFDTDLAIISTGIKSN